MSNDLKNRKRISTTIDNDIYSELKKLSDESMIPITKLFDKAILLLIEEINSKK